MNDASLTGELKKSPLKTDIGALDFVKQIGQGGNALVFSFKKNKTFFAIKFLEHGDARKLSRFQDEFFCAAQIETHLNVARAYHFDVVDVGKKRYSIIIMKQYKESLAKRGQVSTSSDEEKAEFGWRLFDNLADGLAHLHSNSIVHRDIKPENIFFDDAAGTYVIGDLGIGHFSDEAFSRESKTRRGERLANFKFCAPEQVEGKGPPRAAWDIYSMGQVLSWYLYDELVRGVGRKQYSGTNKNLSILDAVLDKCLQNDPARRFASVEEIRSFVEKKRAPQRDIFARLDDLDLAFRSSLPDIDEIYETEDRGDIARFIKNFSLSCRPREFWYIKSDGGDLSLTSLDMAADGRCLLDDYYELKVEKLICYKHPGIWRSFFILLVAADDLFDLVDFDKDLVEHPDASKWSIDVAALYDGKYVDPSRLKNGFYRYNGEVFEVDASKSRQRERQLRPGAFMIVPDRTGPHAVGWQVNKAFLSSVVKSKSVGSSLLRAYLESTLRYVDHEILARL